MEDWKNKYEEITKRVKELHESGNALTKLQMKVICPELAESEDERIREEIINFFRSPFVTENITDEKIAPWIAFLEKHKEQPMELLEPDKNVEKAIEGIIRVYGETQGEWILGFDIDTLIVNLRRAFNQKEQKSKVECDIAQPVEQDGTAEPDYGICDNSVPGKLSAALRRHGWYLGHVGENQQMVEARKKEIMRNWPADRYSLTQEQNLIMANSPQLESQKPVQDKEEKEYVKTLKGLVSDFIRDSGGGISDVAYYQRICDWLDGRHIEQQPAEWSEEEIEKVVVYLHEKDGGMLWSKAKEIALDICNLLRPQPHWKPSEKDREMRMKVLKYLSTRCNVFEYEEVEDWFNSLLFNLSSKQERSEDIIRKAIKEVGLIQHQIDWFKTNVFSPKQEWSEEDERILKGIIGKIDHDQTYGVSKVEMLSFLKSLRPQQKPAEWGEEDEENFKWFDKLFRAESIVVGGRDIPQDKYLWFKSLRPSQKLNEEEIKKIRSEEYTKGFNDAAFGGKSKEWSEEDDIGWDEAFACVTKAEKAAKNEEELQNAVTAEKWLKEIKFKYCVHPQSKQEWSKKDEKMMDKVFSTIGAAFSLSVIDADDKYNMKTWLQYKFDLLRPQQKDNKCISPKEGDIVVNKYGAISIFENWGHHPDGGSFNDKSYFFAKCTLDGDYYNDFDCHPDSVGLRYATPEEIRKLVPYLLASSQPHWKPTEEQMEALSALNCHGGLSYIGQQNQLISLQNDLKKLM